MIRRLLALPITLAADAAYEASLFLDMVSMAVSGADQEGLL